MERIGRYELSSKLGRGGMGVVYRGFDTLLQRTVAVKLIGAQIHDQPGMRERFFREARAAGQLSHKNIITVHDLGEENGQPFLAMEYLEGEDLQQRLNSPAKPSLAAKIDISIQICEGLEYAHSRGVVHRDIKPANIFITNAGVVKILDFGLARLGASQLTNTGMVMGTINYMAPEQVRGEKADHRADIFSTGVLMYEMFSGHKAFEGDSFAATLMKILQDVPEPLDHLDPNVPHELTEVVERALAKRLDQRYQNMSEVRADLESVRRQFDSPTIFAPMLGPSDPTALVSNSVHDRTTPGRLPLSRTGQSSMPVPGSSVPVAGSRVPGSVGPGPTMLDQERPVSGTRSTSPTAPLDSEARQALSGSRPVPSSSRTWQLAAAAVLVLAALGGSTYWLTGGGDPGTTSSPPATVEPPVSQANALPPGPQSPAASGSGTGAGSQPAAPPPAVTPDPAPSAGAPPGRTDPRPTAPQKKPAAPETTQARGQRGDAAGAPPKGEEPRPDPPKPAASPVTLPTVPRSGTEVLPNAPGVATPPPSVAAPPAAPPAAPAPEKPEKKGPTAEEGMNELVERYRAALEARDFDAMRRIWPGLSGRFADALRNEFKQASRIVVDISNRQFKPSGGGGTITFVRRYRVTLDGKDQESTSTVTMTVRQGASSWVIESIAFSLSR